MTTLGSGAGCCSSWSRAVVVAVAGLVAGFNIVLGRSLDRDSRDLVRSRAAAELGSVGVRNGRLTTSETSDERRERRVHLGLRGLAPARAAPRAEAAVDRAARGLASGPSRFHDVPEADARLYPLPIDRRRQAGGHGRRGSLALAVRGDARARRLIASLVFGVLVLLAVAILVRWLVRPRCGRSSG